MPEEKFRARALPVYIVCALLAAGMVVYSQTYAFAWDEGFHLVAAQLIRAGRRPYIDWMFPQTPLNAYWNAFWMRVFPESWRTAHAVAAVETSLAVLLCGLFTLRRFPVAEWRLPAAIFTVAMIGANEAVIEFGALGQAYAFALLAITVAFWLTVIAVDRGVPWAFGAGLFGGIAAGGTLLTAPVAPSLLLWMVVVNRAGSRAAKFFAFLGGVILAFVPVLRLLAIGPRQTWFSIVQYHLYYRQVEWSGAIRHDLETMAGLIDFPQALLLVLLAIGGTLFIYFRSGWARERRQEFYLCVLVTLALVAHLSSAHPTFARYFLFTMPFLTYLGAAGIYFAGGRLWSPERPWLPVMVMVTIIVLGGVKTVYDHRDEMTVGDIEQIAAKVGQAVPPDRPLLADELVFFLLHRLPPPELAVRDSNKLKLPPAQEALLHLASRAELMQRVKAGKYDAVQFCEDDDLFDAEHLTPLFKNHAEAGDCSVYWDWKGAK